MFLSYKRLFLYSHQNSYIIFYLTLNFKRRIKKKFIFNIIETKCVIFIQIFLFHILYSTRFFFDRLLFILEKKKLFSSYHFYQLSHKFSRDYSFNSKNKYKTKRNQPSLQYFTHIIYFYFLQEP